MKKTKDYYGKPSWAEESAWIAVAVSIVKWKKRTEVEKFKITHGN